MAGADHRRAEWLEPPVEEEGLRRYVETIRERIRLVAITILITTGIALLYVLTAPKTYEATANLLVTAVATDDAAIRSLPLIFESSDPTRDVETASQFVSNVDVAASVKERLSLDDSNRELLNRLSAEPVAQSNIVAVTAKAGSPEEARDLANTFAVAAVEDRTAQVHGAIDSQLPRIRAQLQTTSNPAIADTLGAQLAQFETLRNAQDPSFRVDTLAEAPETQATPRPALSLAAGLLGGLILGIAGAFASQALDSRVRRESQLRRLYRLPILARVPVEPTRAGSVKQPLGPRRISSAGAEAYRALRSTLETSSANGRRPQGGPSRVVLVTGASPSEGKSTTAVNLASALALAGNRVILIEADLRRPALGGVLGITPERGGVVSVLIEKVGLREALVETPSYGKNLQVLLADYEGGWIAELFTIPAAHQMIEEARGLADFVIIDSPPLNEVVDALPLARQADDVLIVVRLGRSRLDRIHQLGELMAENGIRPVGFAVVGVPRPGRGKYHYYSTVGRETEEELTERALFKNPTRIR
jgi:capsular exopolysaccharide synthesis family protein